MIHTAGNGQPFTSTVSMVLGTFMYNVCQVGPTCRLYLSAEGQAGARGGGGGRAGRGRRPADVPVAGCLDVPRAHGLIAAKRQDLPRVAPQPLDHGRAERVRDADSVCQRVTALGQHPVDARHRHEDQRGGAPVQGPAQLPEGLRAVGRADRRRQRQPVFGGEVGGGVVGGHGAGEGPEGRRRCGRARLRLHEVLREEGPVELHLLDHSVNAADDRVVPAIARLCGLFGREAVEVEAEQALAQHLGAGDGGLEVGLVGLEGVQGVQGVPEVHDPGEHHVERREQVPEAAGERGDRLAPRGRLSVGHVEHLRGMHRCVGGAAKSPTPGRLGLLSRAVRKGGISGKRLAPHQHNTMPTVTHQLLSVTPQLLSVALPPHLSTTVGYSQTAISHPPTAINHPWAAMSSREGGNNRILYKHNQHIQQNGKNG